jgi:hypothetical protein
MVRQITLILAESLAFVAGLGGLCAVIVIADAFLNF